ncbi:hypothetical protein F5148DRAFT_188290 [Russula earlei]|uniref:Uncharacterized protein n=1 Tax=Russula earlei TaxID=71964 RepID=A0ACC0U7K6_9AGAM|nr:hypothetical protein F5148DRAFT_188290 [Russula earlei]
MVNECHITAYFAELYMCGFFLLLGRVGGKLIGMSFQHLLLVCAPHLYRFSISNKDKIRMANRLQKMRLLEDRGLCSSQKPGCS